MITIVKDIFQIVHFVGSVQGLFIFLLLVTRKQNKMANKFLAALIFLVTVNLAIPFFHLNISTKYDFFRNARMDMFIFFYGPLIAFYTSFLTGFRNKVRKRDYFHLCPALLLLFIQVLSYADISSIFDPIWVENSPFALKVWYIIHATALIHLLAYLIYSLRVVYRYKKQLPAYFSQQGRIYLLWLRVILLSIIFICLLAMLNFFIYRFTEPEGILQLIVGTSVVILVYVMGYFTYKQPDILEELEDIRELSNNEKENARINNSVDLAADREEKTKYEKNRLNKEDEEGNLERFLEYVRDEKPYLDPEINLGQLSNRAKIPAHQLTMLLSIYLKQNFYTFINSYRVEEAKKLLSAAISKEKNILTIAYESGFNSKSTFNRVFKKYVGVTPSQYRNRSS